MGAAVCHGRCCVPWVLLGWWCVLLGAVEWLGVLSHCRSHDEGPQKDRESLHPGMLGRADLLFSRLLNVSEFASGVEAICVPLLSAAYAQGGRCSPDSRRYRYVDCISAHGRRTHRVVNRRRNVVECTFSWLEAPVAVGPEKYLACLRVVEARPHTQPMPHRCT